MKQIIAILMILAIAVPAAFAMDGKVERAQNGDLDRDQDGKMLKSQTGASDGSTVTRTKTTDISRKELRDPEALIERIPTEAVDIAPEAVRNKFLLWTTDLDHYMEGMYGSGEFKAEDNEGNSVWGIYGRRYFAGFYNDEAGNHLFLGRYSRNSWKAVGWPSGEPGLFGLPYARGGLVVAKEMNEKAFSI